MNKFIYLILTTLLYSLVGCGGTSGPAPTIASPVSVTITDCTNTSPFFSSPFQMAISGQGNFRMNNNGSISFINSGTFQLEVSSTAFGCAPLYPGFSGYIITTANNHLTGYNADSNGVLSSTLSDVNIYNGGSMAPSTTHSITAKMHLDSSVGMLAAGTFDPANPATYHYATTINTYDTLGNAHTLQIFYIHISAMTWHIFVVGGGSTIDIGQLNFDAGGNLASSSLTIPMTVSIPVVTGATTPLVMTFDPSGSTESPSAFSAITLTQDGFTFGGINGFVIDTQGKITGNFTNGLTRILGQVAIVPQ